MKTVLLIVFTFMSCNLFAQNFCAIKLVDSYSYESIETSQIKSVSQKNSRIENANSLLILEKPKGKKIFIVAKDYESEEFEIEFKKHIGDTIVLLMKPVDSIIKIRFNDLYSSTNTSDTINFDSINQVETKLNIYLNYLSALNGECDNGMCNYANTYSYLIEFTNEGGIYRIGSITKLKPRGYECAALDNALNTLINNFPKFRLSEKNSEIRKMFTMMLN